MARSASGLGKSRHRRCATEGGGCLRLAMPFFIAAYRWYIIAALAVAFPNLDDDDDNNEEEDEEEEEACPPPPPLLLSLPLLSPLALGA